MRARGFSLVELMVGLTILAIVLMLGVPMYTQFVANTQVRNAAESVLNGLRLAQAEAVKRNAPVQFVLDAAAGWQVRDVAAAGSDPPIQSYSFTEGAPRAKVVVEPGETTGVTFSGLGRVVRNADDSLPIAQIDVTTAMTAEPRDLRVVVGLADVRLCDPKFSSPDPLACP
jgi:type IV fimbrial biogenesis protein FimT